MCNWPISNSGNGVPSVTVDSTPVSLGSIPRVGDVMSMTHQFLEMDGVMAWNCTQEDW